jgi:hypothetical protein
MKYILTLLAVLLLAPLAACCADVDTKTLRVFILAGRRNMEGERAFTQELKALPGQEALADDNNTIAFKYSIGGGYKTSSGWEPLGPARSYDTFGPELSFGKTLQGQVPGNIAIAKFTHSGSQMNDWTPQGTNAKNRNLYPQFIAFIQESIQELQAKGHQVELAGTKDTLKAFVPKNPPPARKPDSEPKAKAKKVAQVDLDTAIL